MMVTSPAFTRTSRAILLQHDNKTIQWSIAVLTMPPRQHLVNPLRKLVAKPTVQHAATSAPEYPRIRDTVPTSTLLGRTLISLWAMRWSSNICDLALFAYGLDDNSFVVFPERFTHDAFLECHLVELGPSFSPVSAVTYGQINDSRLIGCAISDLLVPCDPSDRFPDSQVLQMSSGFGIAQESGAPIGILPSLYLTQGIETGLISMFATTEWDEYRKSREMA
jgi:hypothetical protein